MEQEKNAPPKLTESQNHVMGFCATFFIFFCIIVIIAVIVYIVYVVLHFKRSCGTCVNCGKHYSTANRLFHRAGQCCIKNSKYTCKTCHKTVSWNNGGHVCGEEQQPLNQTIATKSDNSQDDTVDAATQAIHATEPPKQSGILDSLKEWAKKAKGKITRWLPFGADKEAHSASKSLFTEEIQDETITGPKSVFIPTQVLGDKVLQIYVGFGLNYPKTSNELLTCWNDLDTHYNWWSKNIAVSTRKQYAFILTDNPRSFLFDQSRPSLTGQTLRPTIDNWEKVRKQVLDLAEKQHQDGGMTEIVFYFSGHGYKTQTWSEDELDGQAECIVLTNNKFCWDFSLYKDFTRQLPESVHLFAMFDSCHSGTVLNTKYKWNRHSQSANQTAPYGTKAKIWMIPGCQDFETSNSGPDDKSLSVMTRGCFIAPTANILKNISRYGKSSTFVDLHNELRSTLRKMGEVQIPEFSSSHAALFQSTFF